MGCRGHFGPQAEFSGWNTVLWRIMAAIDQRSLKAFFLNDPQKKKFNPKHRLNFSQCIGSSTYINFNEHISLVCKKVNNQLTL